MGSALDLFNINIIYTYLDITRMTLRLMAIDSVMFFTIGSPGVKSRLARHTLNPSSSKYFKMVPSVTSTSF